MSYEQLILSLSTHDDGRHAILQVVTGASTITISDDILWPTAEQMAASKWNNDNYSGTAITYSRTQQQLEFDIEAEGVCGDSSVETVWRGDYADYLAEVMYQLRAWHGGQLEEIPVLADPPAGVTLDYRTENC